jgi:AmmeMemoRadiSam system protein A
MLYFGKQEPLEVFMDSRSIIDLAVKSIQHYLRHGKMLPCPADIPDELKKRAGAFVSIKKQKELRGCIGTIIPVAENLALEIIRNAVHSATEDPRFTAITIEELPHLSVSVDVLTPLEKVESAADLDSKKYGLVLKSDHKQGVLLPDLEGVNSVEEQIKICRKKGRINTDDPVEMFRFQVIRHHNTSQQ